MFKCYNRVPGASINPENVEIILGKPFCKFVKTGLKSHSDSPSCDVVNIILLPPLNLQVSTHGTAIVFSQATMKYQF